MSACTVTFSQFAPYQSLINLTYGAFFTFYTVYIHRNYSVRCFCTVHILRSFSVRCTSSFSHRTHSPQPLCTVHFLFFAPHTFYAASLYGALPLFRTAHILRSLSVRCASSFSHRTHSTQPLCTVYSFTPALYTFSATSLYGAPTLPHKLNVHFSVAHHLLTSAKRSPTAICVGEFFFISGLIVFKYILIAF